MVSKGRYLTLRDKYLPENLRVVFILESPPASGKYFYDEDGSIGEPLFSAMMKFLNFEPPSKRDGLKYFADSGYFLVDATYEPINKLRDTTRRKTILKNYSDLVADLKTLGDPRQIKFILVKANICRLLETRLSEDGFNVQNKGVVIFFPSTGHQREFFTQLQRVHCRGE